MPYSSDRDPVGRATHGRPDPFASLAAIPAPHRFWLIDLLVAPFRDHDERAAYRMHKMNANSTKGRRANGQADGDAAAKALHPAHTDSAHRRDGGLQMDT